MRRCLAGPRNPARLLAVVLMLSAAVAAPLAGCGGGGADDVAADAAGSLIGAPLPIAGGVTDDALDLVGDVLDSIVDLPTRAPQDGTAAQTYVTFENGCEATVRNAEGGAWEGRITGPAGGLPATYRMTGSKDAAEVRFSDGTARRITLSPR